VQLQVGEIIWHSKATGYHYILGITIQVSWTESSCFKNLQNNCGNRRLLFHVEPIGCSPQQNLAQAQSIFWHRAPLFPRWVKNAKTYMVKYNWQTGTPLLFCQWNLSIRQVERSECLIPCLGSCEGGGGNINSLTSFSTSTTSMFGYTHPQQQLW